MQRTLNPDERAAIDELFTYHSPTPEQIEKLALAQHGARARRRDCYGVPAIRRPQRRYTQVARRGNDGEREYRFTASGERPLMAEPRPAPPPEPQKKDIPAAIRRLIAEVREDIPASSYNRAHSRHNRS